MSKIDSAESLRSCQPVEFFKFSEVICPCCGQCLLDYASFKLLYKARVLIDIPFVLYSAYRCIKYNKEVGSTSRNHVLGRAFDIKCLNSVNRYSFIRTFLSLNFSGIGIYPNFIHVDTYHSDVTPMLWYGR